MRRTGFGIASLCVALACAAGGAAGTSSSDPSFAPGPSLPVGAAPLAAAVGDFNKDGSPDLAVANSGYRNNLRILLNDGPGHLRLAGPPLKVGKFPSSVAAADYDGDGKLDLAVASENVRILLGDGTGKFSAAPGSPVEITGFPVSLTAADLTGDGHPDLVMTTYRQDLEAYGLFVLLNDGSGHFAPGPPLTTTSTADTFDIAVADFTGDGKQDLAIAASNTTKLAIRPGTGAGGFGSTALVTVGKNLGRLGVADFNGDGKPDVAVALKTGMAILLGDGAGSLHAAPGSPAPTAPYPGVFAISDLNGDGNPDLAVADSDRGSLDVLIGNGAGRFRRAALSPFFARWPNVVVAADFDGDGKNELLPLSYDISWGPYPRGNWILRPTAATPAIARGRSLRGHGGKVLTTRWVYDIAADGNDVAACTGGAIAAWHAPGSRSRSIPGDCVGELAVGGGRVGWIEYYYGNTHRDYGVFVTKVSGGKPREVDGGYEVETDNPDDPSGFWLGQIFGGGSILAYNSWNVLCVPPPCDQECLDEGGGGCDTYNPSLRVTGQGLSRIGARHAVPAGSGVGVYPLRAAGGGWMAVEPASGVVVLGPKGGRVSTVPSTPDNPARAVDLSKTHLALLRSATLDLYAPATGAKQKSIALGRAAGLQLAGVSSKLALLTGQGHLVLVRLRDGKLVSFPLASAAAKGFVEARLTSAGLFYAYNLSRGKKPGRVVFEPTAKLLARFP